MTLNGLETTKDFKNNSILFLFLFLRNFTISTFLFLELFFDEHAMVLRYSVAWND